MPADALASLRLDKWLWAARFYKTRSLAADEIAKGRVTVNGQSAKASREVKPGDLVAMRQVGWERQVEVIAISAVRGPAPMAQALYADTPDSLAARQRATEQRRLAVEPALSIEAGRPTKRDRRDLERSQAEWQRWSASIDPD